MAEALPATEPAPTTRGLNLESARRAWTEMDPSRKRLLSILVGGLLLGTVLYVALGSAEGEWVPVARGLDEEDMKAASAALEEKRIPHRLDDEGAILVQPEMIHDARLAVAMNAMPSGRTVGFEIFDEVAIGRSAFTEKVNQQRALEGELARTIKHLDGIERVRVHLVNPERRAFREMETEPSASVVVTLAAGDVFTRDKAFAIRQLVAGAVPRLNPNRVSITDQSGAMLARPAGSATAMEDGMEKLREQEQQLASRVERLLEPAIGPGRTYAQVALDWDFAQVNETREDWDPKQQVVRSERDQFEARVAEPGPAVGPVGTAANQPVPGTGGGAVGATTGPARDKSDSIKNYEIGRVVRSTVEPMPRLRRITVAVLVDEAREVRDGRQVIRPRTPEELKRLERLVEGALGLDTAGRKDRVEVTSAVFTPDFTPPDANDNPIPLISDLPTDEPQAEPSLLEDPLMLGLGAVTILLLAFLAFQLARKRKKAAEAAALPAVIEGDEDDEDASPLDLLEESDEERLASSRQRIAELRERAVALANEDVHRLAVVFERWFEEDIKAEREARDKEAA